MNLQLQRVISDISDITVTTGKAIMKAIVSGGNPQTLAALKDGRIQASNQEIAASVTEDYR